ncbi:SDR family NAD(P)-dependent oxidoreductase [Rubrobacter aplysinae]|uniref:SDR family NAD(P)-dependent oxidoreductase n=1 Tax=Rubrobacter aplysinae TaxID=909625 RepID=UPI00064BDE9F|nr:SDR family NAD(P)-dependent oxidoreductase [Rubrobacter aplysinae]
MAKLDGKVAVITGASSGIGEATAEALAAEGASVAVAARRKDRLESLSQRIEGNGGRVLTVECDVTDEGQAHDLIRQVERELGRVDILVNNAGVMLLSRIDKSLSDEWRQMFDVNVLGLLYATDAALEVMKRQQSGHIVNISSVAGRVTNPSSGVYSGTKFAVNAISDGLRKENVDDHLRVTVIEPGAVATELTEHISDDEAKDAIEGMVNRMDPLQSEDVANAIAYAVTQPARVNVDEILIKPTDQA